MDTGSDTTVRGTLIVLEGIDRSGKTSQSARLVQRLTDDGVTTKLMRFPDRSTPTGRVINDYLQQTIEASDEVIHLLFLANRWEAQREIAHDLLRGTTLVIDRYAYSGVAFSSAKGLDIEWCKAPDHGLLKPDAVFFLDLPVAEAKLRGNYGEERYERESFQLRVQQQYTILRMGDGGWSWHVFDARKTPDELGDELFERANRVIARSRTEALGTLAWQ